MKLRFYFLIVALLILLNGCMPFEEESMTLSFWTDRDLSTESYTRVYANDTFVGEFPSQLEDPVCNDSLLLDLVIYDSEDLNLTVRNAEGESVDIGVINLFSVSKGIKIRPSEEGEIFVSQTLDDLCTLVKVNWN